jgi:hypothetical protein
MVRRASIPRRKFRRSFWHAPARENERPGATAGRKMPLSRNCAQAAYVREQNLDTRHLLPRAEIRRLPVTLREYLTLMEAMQQDIAGQRNSEIRRLAGEWPVRDQVGLSTGNPRVYR